MAGKAPTQNPPGNRLPAPPPPPGSFGQAQAAQAARAQAAQAQAQPAQEQRGINFIEPFRPVPPGPKAIIIKNKFHEKTHKLFTDIASFINRVDNDNSVDNMLKLMNIVVANENLKFWMNEINDISPNIKKDVVERFARKRSAEEKDDDEIIIEALYQMNKKQKE
jgi:hypothetical protein